eukprot:CAMPEP_0180552474 /NCGR_PEP_ID=MMETSP1036_2-20121128/73748_1 /TAXON_ID=632150 /ORGANISM="Azadinium spinosum, Strain 3D9" /LENGTH=81 /DNA_ID=CAMNT_0022567897 /DNA_START=383 /DNA_END=624 /DNA_ORIENTATION=+
MLQAPLQKGSTPHEESAPAASLERRFTGVDGAAFPASDGCVSGGCVGDVAEAVEPPTSATAPLSRGFAEAPQPMALQPAAH